LTPKQLIYFSKYNKQLNISKHIKKKHLGLMEIF
jgi:hypothetical protein